MPFRAIAFEAIASTDCATRARDAGARVAETRAVQKARASARRSRSGALARRRIQLCTRVIWCNRAAAGPRGRREAAWEDAGVPTPGEEGGRANSEPEYRPRSGPCADPGVDPVRTLCGPCADPVRTPGEGSVPAVRRMPRAANDGALMGRTPGAGVLETYGSFAATKWSDCSMTTRGPLQTLVPRPAVRGDHCLPGDVLYSAVAHDRRGRDETRSRCVRADVPVSAGRIGGRGAPSPQGRGAPRA
jgi:hypothetical protein